MTQEHGQPLARRGVPDADGAVLASGHDLAAVGAERGAADGSAIAAQSQQLLTRFHVPDPRRAVLPSRDDLFAIGAERSAQHGPFEAARGKELPAGGCVPDTERAIGAGGRDPGAVGAERRAFDAPGVPYITIRRWPVGAIHSFTVPSSYAVSTFVPSGLKAALSKAPM